MSTYNFDSAYIKTRGGKEYYGYKAIISTNSYWAKYLNVFWPLVSTEFISLFNEYHIDSLLDDTFKLNPGDPIHVVPDCKYSIKDIRNNYKIKRDFDSGVCNVFTPLTNISTRYLYFSCYVVIEKYKTILFIDMTNYSQAMSVTKDFFNDVSDGDVDIVLLKDNFISVTTYNKINNYLPLILKTNTKPCVSYKKIEFNTNEMSLDVLTLVKKSGEANKYDKDAEENFLIQLAMLNQHNWRDYPITVRKMFSSIGYYATIKSEVFSHTSRYPKYVNEMRDICNKSVRMTKKDAELLSAFYCDLLGINGKMFVSTKDLINKMTANNMNIEDLNLVFDLTTRIMRKTYEQE